MSRARIAHASALVTAIKVVSPERLPLNVAVLPSRMLQHGALVPTLALHRAQLRCIGAQRRSISDDMSGPRRLTERAWAPWPYLGIRVQNSCTRYSRSQGSISKILTPSLRETGTIAGSSPFMMGRAGRGRIERMMGSGTHVVLELLTCSRRPSSALLLVSNDPAANHQGQQEQPQLQQQQILQQKHRPKRRRRC